MATSWDDFKDAGGSEWDVFKDAPSPKQKGPSLEQILHNQTDETKMMRAGMDAGFDYKEVDRAILAEQQRQAAASEKRTLGNAAMDVAAQPILGAQKMAGGAIQAIGDAIAPQPDGLIDALREQGGVGNIRQIIGKGLSQFGSEIHGEGKAVEKQLQVEMPNSTLEGLYSGVKSTANQAPVMLSPFGTAATLGYLGSQVGLDKYAEARDAGYAPGMAAVAGVGHGGIEIATEILPTKILKEAIAGKIGFNQIVDLVKRVVDAHEADKELSLESVLAAEVWARDRANGVIAQAC